MRTFPVKRELVFGRGSVIQEKSRTLHEVAPVFRKELDTAESIGTLTGKQRSVERWCSLDIRLSPQLLENTSTATSTADQQIDPALGSLFSPAR